MLDDITILYYTAGVLPDYVAAKVRAHLFSIVRGLPIISVSQKPLDFGHNICVGDIGQSYYNCYKQILIGAKAAQTDFVICAEDDTLYTPEHFLHRPASNAFCYNKNMFYLEDEKFWHKWQTGMFAFSHTTAMRTSAYKKHFYLLIATGADTALAGSGAA